MIESVIIGILRLANTSKKIDVKWERFVHLFTPQKKPNDPTKEKASVAIVIIAN